MRKFSIIVLSVLLLMSLTAVAYAIHLPDQPADETIVTAKGSEITLGGRILVRGWWFENLSDFVVGLPGDNGAGVKPSHTDSAFYTTNAYLTLSAKISDNLQGYMELETSSNNSTQSGLYYWGNGGASGSSYLAGQDAKANENLHFRQLWIQYTGSGLLGVPSGIKVGHQLLTLGEKQFYNLERFGVDSIVVFTDPMKELHLYGLTAKHNEGDISYSGDDVDAYAIGGTYALDKDNTIGLFYALVSSSDIDQAMGISAGADELSLQNVGLHANGKLFNALTYSGEADFQFGKLKSHPSTLDIISDSQNFNGWAIMAKLGYMIPDTPLTVRGSMAYGSGESNLDNNDIGEYQFVSALDTESGIARFTHYTLLYERFIRTASLIQAASGPERNTGTANTTYGNLGIDVTPMKDLTFSLDGFYLLASQTHAWEQLAGHSVDNHLGWEVDLKGSYKITKNLTYFVEGGWFDPGDFYKDTGSVQKPLDISHSPSGTENKSVTAVIHGLNFTF